MNNPFYYIENNNFIESLKSVLSCYFGHFEINIQGFIVDLEDFFNNLETDNKKIVYQNVHRKLKRMFELPCLYADSDSVNDLLLLTGYLSCFSEGKLEVIFDNQGKWSFYEDHVLVKLSFIDGDSFEIVTDDVKFINIFKDKLNSIGQ